MAAFTEGFSYHGNNIDVVSKVLAARSLAKAERKYAEKVLALQQKEVPDEDKLKLEDFGIKRGYFFRKALKHEFGGDLYLRKKEKISDIVARVKLLKNPRKNLAKIFEKRKQTTKFSRFRSQFDYKFETSDSEVQAKTPKIPGTAKKIQKATTSSSKRISREQLLDSISDIVKSIGSVATSIESSSSEVKQNIISSNIAQTNIAEQLKTRNETLADKLDKIAAAISQQTQLQKQTAEKREDNQREAQLENAKDVSGTNSFDDLTTKKDESLQQSNIDQDITPTSNIINASILQPGISRPSGGYPSLSNIPKAGMDVPMFERGGIASGPDSGYLAKLHGDEMIIPLDNNYTQGQPSAVDGKVKKKPQMFEKGTSGVGGKFGFGATKNMGIGDTFAANITTMSQPLADAMSLPMMVAGGSVIAATTNLIKNLGESGEELRPEIEKFARPVSDAFGVPTSVMNKAKTGLGKRSGNSGEDGKEDGDSKKNIIAKMLDGFGAFMDKMKESINTNPPPPGQTDLSPVNLQGFSEKEISDLGRMVYAEAGATEGGSAHVLNAILNRYRQIKQGKASPQAWGVRSGVTSEQMTITDLLNAENQFQPIRDGRFDKVSEEQGRAALNAAIQGGGLSPAEIKTKALATGMSEQDASLLAVADTFYNPTVSSNKPFRDAPVVNTDNKHAFMSSPNTGFKPGDLSKLQPVVQTSPSETPPPAQPPQKISQNFGYSAGDRVNFQYNGEEYHAYRDGNDWAFFKGTGIGATLLDRSGNKNKAVVEHFVDTMQQRTSAPAQQEVSFAPPTSREARTNQQVAALNKEVGADAGSTVAFLNMGSSVGGKPSLNTHQPTAQDILVSKGGNPIDSSGLYISQVG
jgi:hypothetical protein